MWQWHREIAAWQLLSRLTRQCRFLFIRDVVLRDRTKSRSWCDSFAKVVVSRQVVVSTLSALRGELTTLGTREELGTSLSPSFHPRLHTMPPLDPMTACGSFRRMATQECLVLCLASNNP